MRILTGIQPTNTLHIGNLFGALIPASTLQEKNDVFMMIADYHAITIERKPEDLRKAIYFATAAYLAAGVDPKRTILFQQSQVPEHTELAWIMETITSLGEAERMTQFKDKSASQGKRTSVGLFAYPMLQAADILLYHAEGVPVGADQKQHIELTRDLALRFNTRFGETFTIPEPLIPKSGARIKSLSEPEKKMSKSAPSAKSYLSLLDDDEMIAKKIRSAVTDSSPTITFDEQRTGLHNLLTIFGIITKEKPDAVAAQYATKGAKALKDDLTEAIILSLRPLRAEILGYLKNEDELKKILTIGSEAAHHIAHDTLNTVKTNIGLKL
ncbi:MAG: tryptophan--tRNA ligase [Patescibacteria group bacterium]|jgi:tryptophanyl-tRNA synthetase